ncbi:hypothetical protein MRX96_021465 [Rhipicephalus microplus]
MYVFRPLFHVSDPILVDLSSTVDESSVSHQLDSAPLDNARQRHCPDVAALPSAKQPTFGDLVGEGKFFNCSPVPWRTCADRIADVEADVLDTYSMPHLSDSTITPHQRKIPPEKPQMLAMRLLRSPALEDMQVSDSTVPDALQIKEGDKSTTPIGVHQPHPVACEPM